MNSIYYIRLIAKVVFARVNKSWLLIIFALFISISNIAAPPASNYYSRANGTWSTSNGGPSCGCTPGQNDNIFVNHNITLAGPFVVNNGNLTVNAGTLTVSGNLTFNNGSTVTVASMAGINVTGDFLNKNNSNSITINGSLSILGNFQNGQGAGTGAVITVGTSGSISFGGSCNNPGTINDYSGSYSGCSQGVLPINLSFFNGKALSHSIALQWATETEKNFDHFIIEKSVDGKSFAEIGSLQGAGFSMEKHDYAFTDMSPITGNNYYRLKAIDFDGYAEYFDVILVNYSQSQNNIAIFPNPLIDQHLVIRVNSDDYQAAYAQIYNSLGKPVGTYKLGMNETEINFESMPDAGVYVVKIYESNQHLVTSQKLIVR